MPDKLKYQCPACGRVIVYGEQVAGRAAKCPGCNFDLVLPNPMASDSIRQGLRDELGEFDETAKSTAPRIPTATADRQFKSAKSTATLIAVFGALFFVGGIGSVILGFVNAMEAATSAGLEEDVGLNVAAAWHSTRGTAAIAIGLILFALSEALTLLRAIAAR